MNNLFNIVSPQNGQIIEGTAIVIKYSYLISNTDITCITYSKLIKYSQFMVIEPGDKNHY